MWIDVVHPPPTAAQLAQYGDTVEQWEKNHEEQLLKNEKELAELQGASYHLTVTLPGIEHFSFTDQPLITAKTTQESDRATNVLNVLSEYIRGFFDKYLSNR